MCFIDWYITRKYGISPPDPLINLDFSTLQFILNNDVKLKNCQIYLSDNQYQTTTLGELNRFLDWDKTDKRVYTSEWLDCDDYSFILTGDINIPGWERLPFGLIWAETNSGCHAANIFIADDHQIYVVEPQNDNICKGIPVGWCPYLVII